MARCVFIGEAFIGEPVALSETETGDHRVRFMTVDLGLIDREHRKIPPFRTAAAEANQS